jgi:hypothetical protein
MIFAILKSRIHRYDSSIRCWGVFGCLACCGLFSRFPCRGTVESVAISCCSGLPVLVVIAKSMPRIHETGLARHFNATMRKGSA